MFPFGHNRYAPAYQSYDPYEQVLSQQELQRRRQAEEHQRRQQLEALNRRRAEQLEYARRQAEIQRIREAEARRRHEMELEARRRKLSEPGHPQLPRPRVQVPEQCEQQTRRGSGRPQSMFGGGMHNLFDALYGNRGHPSMSSQSNTRRARSSDPRAREPTETTGPLTARDTATSGEGDKEYPPAPQHVPNSSGPEISVDAEPEFNEADSTKAQSEITTILKSLSDLKARFSFPNKLDFLSTPGDVTVTVPKLAYTPNNAPLHQFEHLLTGLLTKLDAVDSCGQDSIRKARKDAVKQIEKELEEVDAKKLQEWQNQCREATGTTDTHVEVVEPVVSAPVASAKPNGSAERVEPPAPVVPTLIAPDSESLKEPPESVSTSQTQTTPNYISFPREEDQKAPLQTDSQQPDQSSTVLPTPAVQSLDLQTPSDNTEPQRATTSASTVPVPPKGEAIEDGYVDVGHEPVSPDNEITRNKQNPDDSWEVDL